MCPGRNIECNGVINMRRRRTKRTNLAPAAIVALAVAVRILCEPGAAEAPPETPVVLTQEAPAEATPLDLQVEPVPTIDSSSQPLPEPVTLEWNQAAMESLNLRNQTGYTVTLEELAAQQPHFDAQAEGPTILIVHTHTTEAYTPEPGWEYEASDLMRSMDSSYNMVRIGDEVERVLTEAGYWVIHDETINDYPSYNNSYWTALERIEYWQARYPSIQVVLDLHRDAAEDGAGGFIRTSYTAGGEDMAQLMLVCGTDYGGLEHDGWRQNLAFAMQLQLQLELTHPGITRPLQLRCERFNQHATPMSLLVEVGTVGDTLARALPAAEVLAQALCGVLGNE